jgi:hypothetical protein
VVLVGRITVFGLVGGVRCRILRHGGAWPGLVVPGRRVRLRAHLVEVEPVLADPVPFETRDDLGKELVDVLRSVGRVAPGVHPEPLHKAATL